MIYLLVPVYNEEDNLEKLAKSFLSLTGPSAFFFLFVDDCSKDRSVEMIKELFSSANHHVITKEVNGGPGHSFNLGFEWILERCEENDLVVTLEADGTSDLGILPAMLSLAGEFKFDLVLASVYAQGGGFEKTSFIRKFISFWANLMLRSLFDVKVLTLSSFYRVYQVSLLRTIQQQNPKIIEQSGFVCMFEILLKAITAEARIIEVPMLLRSDERVGASKMKIIRTSKEYLKLIFKNLRSK